MHSFITFLCLLPTLAYAQNASLETQLKETIKGKRAEIGIAVIIDGKDTVTVNNNAHYPLMSVFKFHQALAVTGYMNSKKIPLNSKLFIAHSDLKHDTYSPLRDKYPQGNIEMSIAELLKYTLQLSDNNACDILFRYQGGTGAVNQYIQSLGVNDCNITATEEEMHQNLELCYENWSTPLAAAQLLEVFRKKPLFGDEYKYFIYETMVECNTGKDRLVAPLLNEKGVIVGHKTGTGDRNKKGQQIGCNDIGFVLLPNGHVYTIAVFVKDSKETDAINSKIIADVSRIVYEYVKHELF